MTDYRKRHLAMGLCRDCPRPTHPGSQLCDACAETTRNYQRGYKRRQNAQKRKHGICLDCSRKVEIYMAYCLRHLCKHRERMRLRRVAAALRGRA